MTIAVFTLSLLGAMALGMPIGNRNDPIRVAEEYAMIDVISRGRVEMGFVKGVPFEISPANTNPADLVERFWEAHNLILKAMTTHDGPFNWEGTHFQYRSVNVGPRPYQQPHPPVWTPVGSEGSAMEAAQRGMTIGVLNTGWVRTPAIFDASRISAMACSRRSTTAARWLTMFSIETDFTSSVVLTMRPPAPWRIRGPLGPRAGRCPCRPFPGLFSAS